MRAYFWIQSPHNVYKTLNCMIVKKIGHLLLIRLKLFQILAKLAPLGVIASFFMIFFFFHFKQSFQFQEPSLRTRLEDVKSHKPQLTLHYKNLYDGISFIKVPGAMDNECLLVTIPQKMQNTSQVKNIYETLVRSTYNSKNIIILSYQSVDHLNSFFYWYYNPKENKDFSFGIIRAGINLEFIALNNSTVSTKADNETRDKAYYNIYMPGLHPDLDYFFSLKDLMQVTLVSWSPCQQIYRVPLYRSIRKWFIKLEKQITNKHDVKVFIQHVLCQIHNHLSYELTPHQIMMNHGFQAGTIKFHVGSNRQKPEQVVLSFLKEFSLQQDHLHSARIFFYPLSKTEQLPLNATLFPSLIFLLAVVLIIINRVIKIYSSIYIEFKYLTCVILYVWIWQSYSRKDYSYTLITALVCAFISIIYNLINNQTSVKSQGIKKNVCQIILEAFSGLIALYHSLFCYSLSVLAMFTTSLLVFTPFSSKLKSIYRLAIFLSLLYLLTNVTQNIGSLFSPIFKLSCQLQVILIVMLLQLSM